MGGHFSWLPLFEGAKGGTPQKISIFFTKSCQIAISLKSEKNNRVMFAKYCIIIISARGGEGPPSTCVKSEEVLCFFLLYSIGLGKVFV